VVLLLRAILEQNRKYRKSENMEKTCNSEKVAVILVVSQQNGVPIGTKLPETPQWRVFHRVRCVNTLLHNDRDFDPFEQHLGLKVLR